MDFLVPSIIGVLLAVAIIYTPLKRIGEYFETIFHELGHAFIGILLGKRLSGFKLRADTSGTTITLSNGYGFRSMLSTLAGYPAPIAFATTMMTLSFRGYYTETMVALMVVSVFMLLFIRNFFAVVPLAFMGGFAYLGFYLNNSFYSVLLIAFLSTMIFILGIDSLYKLFKYRPEGSDATILKFYIGGAERFWIGLMMIITAVDSILFPYIVNLALDQLGNISMPSF